MQPNAPNAPRPPQAVQAGQPFSIGPGMLMGMVALFILIYFVDQAAKGEVAVFSGVERRISTRDFHGTGCTAIFGGCTIDLRDAEIQGTEAVVHTFAIFGGAQIRVPEDWEIVNRGVAIFGGINENRHRTIAPAKRLIIEGAAVFGGVEIKN